MPAQITAPGWWAVSARNGEAVGLVRYNGTGDAAQLNGAVYLGQTESDVKKYWGAAMGQLGTLGGYEINPSDAISAANGNGGSAIFTKTPSTAVWDMLPTVIVGSLAAIAAAPFTFAGAGAADTATGSDAAAGASAGTAAGAGEAAAGGAAGGTAASAVKSAASKVASTVAGNAGKVATGLTLAGLFTDIGWWKGAGMVLAGAILVILALRQMAF